MCPFSVAYMYILLIMTTWYLITISGPHLYRKLLLPLQHLLIDCSSSSRGGDM